MDRSWRPGPTQGNICPICSVSHFPFCPPNLNARHSLDYNRPNFDSNEALPVNMNHLGNPNQGDPYSDSRCWNRNPSLEGQNYGDRFQMHQPYTGDACGVSRGGFQMHNFERSCNPIENEFTNNKRLRIDAAHYESNWCDVDHNLSRRPLGENERRLNLIREHGGAAEGLGVSGQHFRHGFSRDMGGYMQERLARIHDNDHNRRHVNLSETGIGQPGGYGVDQQREEHPSALGLEYQYSDMNGIQSGHGYSGNKMHSEDHQHTLYGQGRNPYYPEAFEQGVVAGDRYLPNSQMGSFRKQSPADQHTTHGSCEFSNEKFQTEFSLPRHHNLRNWKDSHWQSAHEQHGLIRDMEDHYSLSQKPNISEVQTKYGYHASSQPRDTKLWVEARPPTVNDNDGPTINPRFPVAPQYGAPQMGKPGAYGNFSSPNVGHLQASGRSDVQPPLPSSPPPPLPGESAGRWSMENKASSSPTRVAASVFPIAVNSLSTVNSSYPAVAEAHSSVSSYLCSLQPMHASDPFPRDSQATSQSSYQPCYGEGQHFPPNNNFSDRPKTVDASQLFKPPHRSSRPDHFVIILRGLPGSGKSYLAKMLRDLEVECGGDAPRIHSMDDYFMAEVEKVDENDNSKSSIRGKKLAAKKVLEYCYEPEMEEAYRSSMLKAFKKTLEEGVFTFIIVDDRNLRVADFAQFWATAKRSGYEVYLLEAPYKDPVGCTARNIHGFSLEDIEKMAAQWEEAPNLYLQLDVKSLFHGDDLTESRIQEVDMDMEDGDPDIGSSKLEKSKPEKIISANLEDSLEEKRRNADGDDPLEEVKDLGQSKWLGNLEDDEVERTEVMKRKPSALSGLLQTYSKEGWQQGFLNKCFEERKYGFFDHWSWCRLQSEVQSVTRGRYFSFFQYYR